MTIYPLPRHPRYNHPTADTINSFGNHPLDDTHLPCRHVFSHSVRKAFYHGRCYFVVKFPVGRYVVAVLQGVPKLTSHTLSDNNARAQATQQLEQAAQENFVSCPSMHTLIDHADVSASQPAYMQTLVNELANESADNLVRNAAGLAIKNALTGRVSAPSSRNDLALTINSRNRNDNKTSPSAGSPSPPTHVTTSSTHVSSPSAPKTSVRPPSPRKPSPPSLPSNSRTGNGKT